MLTTSDVAKVLEDVRYYPGWTFSVRGDHPEGMVLTIRAEVVDAYHQDETTVLSIDTFVPPCPRPRDFLMWLAWRCGRIAMHESAEFLRYRGHLVRDPHATWGM